MAATEQGVLNYWLKDPAAVELAGFLIDISQIWDDLIDQDEPVSNDAVNKMMRYALVDIPKNTFYQQHFCNLHPILEDRLYTWLDANTLEAGGDYRDLQVSYIIRSVITDIVIHIAFLAGGFEHRQRAALAIRQFVYRDNESFNEYLAEHTPPEGEA